MPFVIEWNPFHLNAIGHSFEQKNSLIISLTRTVSWFFKRFSKPEQESSSSSIRKKNDNGVVKFEPVQWTIC